ncbi:uncharacterized protein DS421_15g500170 [Arachis hypogaea]|nr:uncharacterized protein DS421_15g500170 [Arachis hypogaea]
MTTGSRSRSSGSHGHGREKVSIESPRTAQSSPSTLTTPSTPVMSQAGPADQQFIMVPNPNYVPSSAMTIQRQSLRWVIPLMRPSRILPPPPPVIRLRILT